MKAVYETPHVYFETFAANNAVATGSCLDGTVTTDFFCLRGGSLDKVENIISSDISGSNCSGDDLGWWASTSTKPIYAASGSSVFGDPTGQELNNRLTWATNDDNTIVVKEAYRKDFLGWFYYCTDMKSDAANDSHWGIMEDVSVTAEGKTETLDVLYHTQQTVAVQPMKDDNNNKNENQDTDIHSMVYGVWNNYSDMTIWS